MLPALRPMMPLRTGPTLFFAVSPIWWQALHTPNTFSPAAASWALTSPAPATANSATKTTARIPVLLFGWAPFRERKSLSYRGKSVDPTFGQPADSSSQAPRTIKVPSASTMRACRFGRTATICSIRDNGIELNAVESASASVALLESLLLKDIIAWSQGLTAAQRKYLMTLDPSRLPPHFLTPPDQGGLDPGSRE